MRAAALFGEQLVAVADDQWDRPTPCVDWDVRAVTAHVVVGDAQIPELYADRPVARVQEVSPTVLGADPVAAWRGTALAAIEAFGRPGALDEVLHHPVGDLPGRHVIGFRVTDHLVHGWDVSVALGQPIVLPADIAEWCLRFWEPMASGLSRGGYFAPLVAVDADAPPADRLLALLGRQASAVDS